MTEPWMLHDMEDLTIVTVEKPGKFVAVCASKSFTNAENTDHAHLIAAAPDLLSLAKSVIGFCVALRQDKPCW